MEKEKEKNLSNMENNLYSNPNYNNYSPSKEKKSEENAFKIKKIENNKNIKNERINNNNKYNNNNSNEQKNNGSNKYKKLKKVIETKYPNDKKVNINDKLRKDNNKNDITRDTSTYKNSTFLYKNKENTSYISDIILNFPDYQEQNPFSLTDIDNKIKSEKEILNYSGEILNSCDRTEKFKKKFKSIKRGHYRFKSFESFMTNNSDFEFTDSDFISTKNLNENEIISLGINIGAQKTVYSIFSKVNDKYISHVLLMNNFCFINLESIYKTKNNPIN